MLRIGLISDTHALLRPEALAALRGVEVVLHAGDVGARSILQELEAVAPVHAVAGNVDDPALGLPERLQLSLGGLSVIVTHGHRLARPTPEALARQYRADIIVYGHTHKPLIQHVGSTLVVNPGAAGPRRFNLRPSVALLTIENRTAHVDLITLST